MEDNHGGKLIFDGKYEVVKVDVDVFNSCYGCDFNTEEYESGGCDIRKLIMKEYNIDCSLRHCFFKKVKRKIGCSFENTKIGDEIFFNIDDEKYTLLYLSVHNKIDIDNLLYNVIVLKKGSRYSIPSLINNFYKYE